MTMLWRVQTVITGLLGGDALSTFHFRAETGTAVQANAQVIQFWNALAPSVDAGIVFTPTGEVVGFEDTTGEASTWQGVPTTTNSGTASGERMPASTQGLIQWFTDAAIDGRRLRGRTFVPGAVEGASIGDGVPSVAYRAAMQSAADSLVSATEPQLCVWSRPIEADPEASPPVEGRSGSSAVVLSATTWNKWAILRSRRD